MICVKVKLQNLTCNLAGTRLKAKPVSGRVPFQPTPIKLPNAHDPGIPQMHRRPPGAVAESPSLAHTTAHETRPRGPDA